MPAPAWLIGLLVKAIWAGVRKHRARKRAQQIQQRLEKVGVMNWLLELGFLKGYRTKIGVILYLLGVLGSAMTPDLLAAMPALVPVAHALQPIGAAVVALGIRFKN